MNQHLVAKQFNDLLKMYTLSNHVTFPTQVSGSSLDPILMDLPDEVDLCQPLGTIGSSDHSAVLTTINIIGDDNEAITVAVVSQRLEQLKRNTRLHQVDGTSPRFCQLTSGDLHQSSSVPAEKTYTQPNL